MTTINTAAPAAAFMALAALAEAKQIPSSALPAAILANHGGNVEVSAVASVSTGFVAKFIEEEFLLDEFTAASIVGATDSIGDAVAMAFVVARELTKSVELVKEDGLHPALVTPTARALAWIRRIVDQSGMSTVDAGRLVELLDAKEYPVYGVAGSISLLTALEVGEVSLSEARSFLRDETKFLLVRT